jgi:hypothetical protein
MGRAESPRVTFPWSSPIFSYNILLDILQIPDPLGVILRRWKLRGNELRWQPTR